MTDQNKPYEQIPTETSKQEGDQNIPPETSPPPVSPPPPSSPTVVIPPNTESTPKWFYLLFGITLVVFFAMTIFLIATLRQKQAKTLKITPLPTVTATITKAIPSITPVSEATDPAILKLTSQGTADTFVELESDVENTDFSPIEQIITKLDEQMGFSSE